jgi:hypothetical protein
LAPARDRESPPLTQAAPPAPKLAMPGEVASRDAAPVTTAAKGKVPADYGGGASGEDTLVVHRGEVVKGVCVSASVVLD